MKDGGESVSFGISEDFPDSWVVSCCPRLTPYSVKSVLFVLLKSNTVYRSSSLDATSLGDDKKEDDGTGLLRLIGSPVDSSFLSSTINNSGLIHSR